MIDNLYIFFRHGSIKNTTDHINSQTSLLFSGRTLV